MIQPKSRVQNVQELFLLKIFYKIIQSKMYVQIVIYPIAIDRQGYDCTERTEEQKEIILFSKKNNCNFFFLSPKNVVPHN